MLTADVVRQARQLHKEGLGYAELSRRLGVSKDAVRKALIGNTWKDHHMAISPYKPKGEKKSRLSKEGRDKIMELHHAGHSAVDIARQLGIHRGTVSRHINNDSLTLSLQ